MYIFINVPYLHVAGSIFAGNNLYSSARFRFIFILTHKSGIVFVF